MVKAQVPEAAAAAGAGEQLTYIQATYAVSAAPGAKSPSQSLGLGDVTPAHWTDTVAPAATVDGLALRLGGTLTPKVAVTVVVADIVTVQEPVPEQPPSLQPVKLDPVAGIAVSVTAVPLA